MFTSTEPFSKDLTHSNMALQYTQEQDLLKNEQTHGYWEKLKEDHVSVRNHLEHLPHKLSYEVMVPVGSKALFRGNMVHTNEILVCLGDGWFVKQSSKEAAQICDRRIKMCDSMLQELKREQELITNRKQLPLEEDAFGGEGRQEIIEPYIDEQEAKWRESHRQREKEYHQKLAVLRQKEQPVIKNEEDLWERLNDLELQEELEEELDRLHAYHEGTDEDISEEEEDEDNEDVQNDAVSILLSVAKNTETHDIPQNVENGQNDSTPEASSGSNQPEASKRRRVSFADQQTKDEDGVSSNSDSDSIDEPPSIKFSHTLVEDEGHKYSESDEIQTPADIYNHYKHLHPEGVARKSILKNKTNLGNTTRMDNETFAEVDSVNFSHMDSACLQQSEEEFLPPIFGDVVERIPTILQQQQPSSNLRPVSRFRAARQAANSR